jgi:hypothetical protein
LSLWKKKSNRKAISCIDENGHGHSGFRWNDRSFPDCRPLTSLRSFSNEHHDNPENHQNYPNAVVDPCHRLHAAEPADMMRHKAFQKVRRQRCGQDAGKEYSGRSVVGAIPGTDGNNYRNPDKPDAGVKDIQEKTLDDIQMVPVQDANEFIVLIGICLNNPFFEGINAYNCQNHPADDLKPRVVPGIDAQELRYAEKTKHQDKYIA